MKFNSATISESKREQWAYIQSRPQPDDGPQEMFDGDVLLQFAGDQIVVHADIWARCYGLTDEKEIEWHIKKLMGEVKIHWKKDEEDDATADLPF